MKNDVIGERTYVSSIESLYGKLFIAFIGMIMRRDFTNRLKKIKDKKHSLTVDQCLMTLLDIEMRKTGDRWLLKKALTSDQKKVMEAFGIPITILEAALPV
ncbi:MAG: hypothetical protein IAB19_00785 [Proteobacteria bacterium]|uniref:Uncharacterized protein n=1 Tax=Candidatus Avisuccinivibrio stercorigallinarum TaxID=2840704 RepID=A0A9D9D815_9GAMM|nr:hypothetical protein [Candidatus Avisuccinivibrio stercorigallinarum]